MNEFNTDQIPEVDIDTEKYVVSQVLTEAETPYLLYNVIIDPEHPSTIALRITKQPLGPGQQGSYFKASSDESAFKSVAIETKYASSPNNLIARVAVQALALQANVEKSDLEKAKVGQNTIEKKSATAP